MKNEIVRLKGPDSVRKRPAVMFGSAGADGAAAAVKMLLNIFISEAARGCSGGIDLTVNADSSVSVRSYDRGLILDETVIDGKPVWQQIFCEFFCGRWVSEDNSFRFVKHCNDLYGNEETVVNHGFDLCHVQYASAFMHVESTRDGIRKTVDFEKGYSVSDLKKEPSPDPSNTYIRFRADPEVFTDVTFPLSEITDCLRDAAATIPGLKCTVHDDRDGSFFTFLYPNGTADYAMEIAGPVSTPLFINEIAATGKDRYNYREYDAKVRIVFAFVENRADIICLHNYRKLYGGSHLDAVKKRLMCRINREFIRDLGTDCGSREISGLLFEDIKDNIILILETNCAENASDYVNATKKAISNRMIAEMAHDLISEKFDDYLRQNHETIFNILKNAKKTGEKA